MRLGHQSEDLVQDLLLVVVLGVFPAVEHQAWCPPNMAHRPKVENIREKALIRMLKQKFQFLGETVEIKN